MTLYPFEMQIAVDAYNPGTVVQDGNVTICDPGDATNTPIALLDPAGVPMSNPIKTSRQGFIPAFQATIPHVKWSDGTYAGYLSSYKGLLDEAKAAALAAQQAANVSIPTDGNMGDSLMKGSLGPYWGKPIVVIGPTDPWPTGLPEGTLVVRTSS